MKTSFMLKLFVVLPFLLFIDYTLMAILGCTTCLLGFGNDFYCGTYCALGKLILVLSGVFFIFIIFPDIKNSIKNKHVSTQEK